MLTYASVVISRTILLLISPFLSRVLNDINWSALNWPKAFDVVNHIILQQKRKIYEVSHPVLQWFYFYQSDRKQCVRINGYTSYFLPINQGIPSRNHHWTSTLHTEYHLIE